MGGNGTNRRIRINPLPDQSGSTTITVTVSDGNGGSTATGFNVTVTAVNDAPTISNIPDQSIAEDSATATLPFTVGDAETSASALAVSAASSNTNLVAAAGITLGGSGTNRTIRINPLPDQSGSTTITVTVSDGNGGSTATGFNVTVTAVNDAPILSPIQDRTINEGETLTLTNAATDVDGPSLSFSLTTGPSGAAIDAQTGVLTWTPLESQGPSTNPIAVVVRDNGSPNLSATQSFTVFVTEV